MRSTTTMSIAAAVALVLSACGGGDDDAASGSDDGELVIAGDGAADETISTDGDAGASQTDEEQALAFAQCMRDEGVDFPDPTTNADGSIDFFGGLGPGGGGGFDPNDTSVQDAIEVCGSLIDGASFLPNGGDGFDAETQDTLLEFTQCLRDNGLDVDDPDFSNFDGDGGFGGGGGGGGLLGGFDPNDPAAQEAIDACQGLFAGGPFGGGGN